MPNLKSNQTLDEVTLQESLRRATPRLRAFVQTKLPPKLRSQISPEDLLQEVYIDAFRGRSEFRNVYDDSVDRWLTVITQRRLVAAIKTAKTQRRGGAFQNLWTIDGRRSSLLNIFRVATSRERTPSSAAAVDEAVDTVQIAIASLPAPRRQAISLYYMEGKSYEEIARVMNKTEPAVRSLLFHGLRQLRDHLGRASRFISDFPMTSVPREA